MALKAKLFAYVGKEWRRGMHNASYLGGHLIIWPHIYFHLPPLYWIHSFLPGSERSAFYICSSNAWLTSLSICIIFIDGSSAIKS